MYTKFLSKFLHNPTVLLAPVIIIVIVLTPLARNFNPVAIWYDRSYDVLSLTGLLGPFVAAIGAWEGARVARVRRRSGEQSIVWVRQVTTWAQTAAWGLLLYLLIWVVVWLITATQATWGGPLVGPPLMGAVAILALSALGYTLGDLWSSRIAAPIVGVVLLALQSWLSSLGTAHNPIGYLTPNFADTTGFTVWYHVRSDLVIVQMTFAFGLLALALASLALRKCVVSKRVYPWILAICGVTLVFASFAGIASSSVDSHGVRVPFVYNAASDALIPYTPVCSQMALLVCVHSAYSAEITQLALVVNRLAAPLIGIPGAPVRAEQRPPINSGDFWHIDGNVLVMQSFAAHASDWVDQSFIQQLSTQIAVGLVIAPGPITASPQGEPFHKQHFPLSTTQQAMALYLLQQANVTPDPGSLQVSTQARAFEQNFAIQSLAARRAWLAQHYVALSRGSFDPVH